MRLTVAVILLCTLAARADAANSAVDASNQTAYEDGWGEGDDGGAGWEGPWAFLQSANAGFAIGSSTLNGNGDTNQDGDIDIADGAFLLTTLGAGTVAMATRFFSGGPFDVGQVIAISLDNDLGADGQLAFILGSMGGPRFLFRSLPGTGYEVQDAAGFTALGLPLTDEGVRLEFVQTSPDTYEIEVDPLDGAPLIHTGTLMGSDAIFYFNVRADGESAAFRTHAFNLIIVPEPTAVASALGAGLSVLACARVKPRRRRAPAL